MKNQFMELPKKYPIITGIAMLALSSLLVINGLQPDTFSFVHNISTAAFLGCLAPIIILGGFAYIQIKKKLDEKETALKTLDEELKKSSNDAKLKTDKAILEKSIASLKTAFTAMKILTGTLILGAFIMNQGLGSQFFSTDMSYSAVAPFLGGIALGGYGAFTLFTGLSKKAAQAIYDKNEKKDAASEAKIHTHVSRYTHFAKLLSCLAVFAVFGLVAYHGFYIYSLTDKSPGLSAGVVTSFAMCAILITAMEKLGDAVRGVRDPSITRKKVTSEAPTIPVAVPSLEKKRKTNRPAVDNEEQHKKMVASLD